MNWKAIGIEIARTMVVIIVVRYTMHAPKNQPNRVQQRPNIPTFSVSSEKIVNIDRAPDNYSRALKDINLRIRSLEYQFKEQIALQQPELTIIEEPQEERDYLLEMEDEFARKANSALSHQKQYQVEEVLKKFISGIEFDTECRIGQCNITALLNNKEMEELESKMHRMLPGIEAAGYKQQNDGFYLAEYFLSYSY